MDAITLQPAAGAHGEMTGLLMVRAYHQSKGNAAQEDSDSRLSPRHQSGHSCDGGLRRREFEIGFPRHGRHCRARVADERRRRRAHADQSQHARRVRARHPQDRRHPARQRRPALHGRRQHECARGQSPSRRFRRRRHAPQPAQDIFDSARWRRPWLRSGSDQEGARAISAEAGRDHEIRRHARLRI